ncbi:MAG: Helicase associated domain protein [Lachnospiraceae bacterium]|nr:Helicase associated domain protein [Lachnospiraceae bacterium]
MGSILFKHNQKAYEAVNSLLEETGRAAVIHPTGTGKSFLAFQLGADHINKVFCWLSPSEYIFQTQEEKWWAAGGKKLKNIYFFTYARLMRMKREELIKIKPDYIILDEFHRCGAVQWGEGVSRLRTMYPQAKVMGLSATNIRYLDGQRDMAWELFGGNIASEMTLGSAIAQGILPAPKYVLSVYSCHRELAQYQERVRQVKNKAVRNAAEKELEALRRALEKAEGLPDVFAKHMDLNHPGKYIVFCANFGHMEEMQALAGEWFSKVDPHPHIYKAYSGDMTTRQEFEAFKADGSNCLRLLYCIDMLNEGIHVDGLNGVILLRPTVSPIIYKQQVGRALAAGGGKEPVIFDIVMNIGNLCSIGVIEEELREAVLVGYEGIKEGLGISANFRIVDELGDCRKLFMKLNETLGASWEVMYEVAKEYYSVQGHLNVPVHYITSDGYSLGAWLATQRKVYTGKAAGYLDEGRVAKLNSIGMCWKGIQEASWDEYFLRAEEYYLEHGDLDMPAEYETDDGCRLGRWIRRQREVYRKAAERKNTVGSIESDKENTKVKELDDIYVQRMEALEQIGMEWENENSWVKKFLLAKKYYDEHGNLDMPADYVVDGVWLDRWLRVQRAKLREEEKIGACQTFLTQEQKEKLATIGMVSGQSRLEQSWQQQYWEARDYYFQYGNLSVPKRYVGKNGKNLGNWVHRQRLGRRKGLLSVEQVDLLDRIGMVWNPGSPWKVGFTHAEEYYKQNGHLAVPNQYICVDGYRLGKWISNQRLAMRTGKGLGMEQVQQLEGIGMIWEARACKQTDK